MGVRRLAERGRRWPRARSAAFAGGLFLIVVSPPSPGSRSTTGRCSASTSCSTCCSGWSRRCFLVLGAPVTLALQACRRPAQQRLLRVLHSRPVAVVTHPAVVWVLFGGTLVVLYFTGLYELSLRNDVGARARARALRRRRLPVHGIRRGDRLAAHGVRVRRAPALRARAAAVPHVRRRRAARQRPRARVGLVLAGDRARGVRARSTTNASARGSCGAPASCWASSRWRSSSTSGCATRSGRGHASTGAWTPRGRVGVRRSSCPLDSLEWSFGSASSTPPRN